MAAKKRPSHNERGIFHCIYYFLEEGFVSQMFDCAWGLQRRRSIHNRLPHSDLFVYPHLKHEITDVILAAERYILRRCCHIHQRLSKTESMVSFLQFKNALECCIALVLVAPKGVSTLLLFAETLHGAFVSYTSTVNFTLRIYC